MELQLDEHVKTNYDIPEVPAIYRLSKNTYNKNNVFSYNNEFKNYKKSENIPIRDKNNFPEKFSHIISPQDYESLCEMNKKNIKE